MHVVLLVPEEPLDSISEHAGLLVGSVPKFDSHLSQSFEYSKLAAFIVIKVVFFGERFQALEGADDIGVIFGENVVGREETFDLLAEFLILYLQFCEKTGGVGD